MSATQLVEAVLFSADPVGFVVGLAFELTLRDQRRVPIEKTADCEQVPAAPSRPTRIVGGVVLRETAAKICGKTDVHLPPFKEQQVHIEAGQVSHHLIP